MGHYTVNDKASDVAKRVADGARQGQGEQGESDEEADHQRGDRAESPALHSARGAAAHGRHTGTGASVTRRSWKCGSTG